MGSIDVVSSRALQAGVQGYHASSETLSRSASVLADTASGRNGTGQSANLHSAVVDLSSGLLQEKTSAAVIDKVGSHNGVLGSIIDTYA